MSYYHRLAILVLLQAALVFVASGCGPRQKSVFPVGGKVVAGTEKKPAKGAMVILTPVAGDAKDPTRSFGTVGDDGSFAITTYNANDGAPAGDYVITLTWMPARKSVFEEDGEDRLKGAFADATKSKLRYTVQAVKTGNEIPLIELP